MALSERSRTTIYLGLNSVIDDEQAVSEMLSYFPARDVEEPVTKEFLRAEIATVRIEMGEMRSEIRSEMADFKAEMRDEMADFKAELRSDMATHRSETQLGFADIRTDMEKMFRTTQAWTVGTGISLAAVVLAATRFLA